MFRWRELARNGLKRFRSRRTPRHERRRRPPSRGSRCRRLLRTRSERQRRWAVRGHYVHVQQPSPAARSSLAPSRVRAVGQWVRAEAIDRVEWPLTSPSVRPSASPCSLWRRSPYSRCRKHCVIGTAASATRKHHYTRPASSILPHPYLFDRCHVLPT